MPSKLQRQVFLPSESHPERGRSRRAKRPGPSPRLFWGRDSAKRRERAPTGPRVSPAAHEDPIRITAQPLENPEACTCTDGWISTMSQGNLWRIGSGVPAISLFPPHGAGNEQADAERGAAGGRIVRYVAGDKSLARDRTGARLRDGAAGAGHHR